MKDLISRENALLALDDFLNSEQEYGIIASSYSPADVERAKRRINCIPAEKDDWINIEESKPKDMQQVLAVVDGDVREAFYNAGCFIGSNFYRSIVEVKWWQPLPEPPKE